MHTPTADSASTLRGLRYRRPRQADAASVHALIEECKPLDLNSPYAYLLLCTHFSDTSAVAEVNGMPRGFVAGYLKPSEPSVLFVWQIAVGRDVRGHGIGAALLQDVLSRPACGDVRYLEATITPSNQTSWALFRSVARARGARCHEAPLFRAEDFGGGDHEEEQLLRIGPFEGPGDAR